MRLSCVNKSTETRTHNQKQGCRRICGTGKRYLRREELETNSVQTLRSSNLGEQKYTETSLWGSKSSWALSVLQKEEDTRIQGNQSRMKNHQNKTKQQYKLTLFVQTLRHWPLNLGLLLGVIYNICSASCLGRHNQRGNYL